MRKRVRSVVCPLAFLNTSTTELVKRDQQSENTHTFSLPHTLTQYNPFIHSNITNEGIKQTKRIAKEREHSPLEFVRS